jgi:hypothetical protein
MPERIPQSVARRQLLKVYLASDHVSAATGKTVAVVISKNGGAFGNPSAGATNATEIGSGWYYVDLSTTDTGTAGPLVVRGTASACDDAEERLQVASAHNAGFDGVPDAAAGANGGLPLGNAAGRVDVGNWLGAAPDALSSGKVPADLKLWLTTAPLALSSQQVQTIVTAMGADVVTAAAIATDAIGAAELAASAVTEIQTGLSTLDAAGVRSAVGLATGNLDTQLAGIPAAVWAAGTRTLTSFGTLVADVAAAVWAAATRTLTSFGALVSDLAGQVTTDHGSGSYVRNTEPDNADIVAAKTVTDHLATALELNGPAYRFTTAALAQAPGGGASVTVYGQDGAITFTYTVYDTNGTTPLEGVEVWAAADSAGTQRSASRFTDAFGRVVFNLDPGTVYFFRRRADRVFTDPDAEVVS